MLTDEEHILIKIQFLTFLAGSMAGIFLQVFIFKLAGLRSVILYNLYLFSFVFLVCLVSGYLLKHFSTKLLIKAGLILYSVSWIIVLILREQSVNHIFLIGSIYGIAAGLYWSGYNLSQYILTHSLRRADYFSRNIGFTSLANIIGPLLGGAIILLVDYFFHTALGGYYLLFFLTCLLYFCNFLISSRLPKHIGIEFSLKDIFSHLRAKKWYFLLGQQLTLGFYDVAFPAVSGIVLFVILRQEFALGVARTVIGLLSALASFYASRHLKKYPNSFMWGALISTFGIILFALFPNIIGIVGLGLSSGIGFAFLGVSISVAILNTLDDHKKNWKYKYFLFMEREAALGIGRIASYILILAFFVPSQGADIARGWILAISPLPILVAYFTKKLV